MPVGSIVMWTPESSQLVKLTYPDRAEDDVLYEKRYDVTTKSKTDSGQVQTQQISVIVKLPVGWVPCFGQIENLDNGATFQTPDMFDKYIKCSLTGTNDSGFTHHVINAKELPAHVHKFPTIIKGNLQYFPTHSHKIDFTNLAKNIKIAIDYKKKISKSWGSGTTVAKINTNNFQSGLAQFDSGGNANETFSFDFLQNTDTRFALQNADSNYTQDNSTTNNPIPVTPFARNVIPIIKIRNVR